MEQKPIGVAGRSRRAPHAGAPDTSAWLKENADSVGAASAADGDASSYEENYLDLDPTVKDDLGRPVVRITFDLKDNEMRAALWIQDKLKQW